MSQQDNQSPIQLSIVASSRNDNHGKNLLRRMQYFIDGVVHQTEKYQIPSELILVEWNPLPNHPSLEEALRFPKKTKFCKIRIIQVPNELHNTVNCSDKLPFFQMIAKNVGIRRAKGQFVLATNIDILFSHALMQFLKSKLNPKYLYRVDRLDVPEEVPEVLSHNELLSFCQKSFFRINSKYGTYFHTYTPYSSRLNTTALKCLKKIWSYLNPISYALKFYRPVQRYSRPLLILSMHIILINPFQRIRKWYHAVIISSKKLTPKKILKSIPKICRSAIISTQDISRIRIPKYVQKWCYSIFLFSRKTISINAPQYIRACCVRIYRLIKRIARSIAQRTSNTLRLLPLCMQKLHTNACGDFTLMSSTNWFNLRGYPEWGMYSWHIDSVLLHQAQQHGIVEYDLPRSKPIYHIEHEIGSGYSPEAPDRLFGRLRARGISYISNEELDNLIQALEKSSEKIVYNDPNWGFGDKELQEIVL